MTQLPWWPVRQRDRTTAEPISVDDVVAASLELLRTGGADALSMRKVAAELGVSVSTVYWWAGNKEQLLALVADTVHGTIEVPPADPSVPWIEQLRTYATRAYAAYEAHPFVVPIIAGGVLTGPHTLDVVEGGLAILEVGGLSAADAVAAQSALAALILGFQRTGPRASGRDTAPEDTWTGGHRLDAVDAERYPMVVARADELHTADAREQFAFALDVFLAGLDAHARGGRRRAP